MEGFVVYKHILIFATQNLKPYALFIYIRVRK